MSRRILIVLCSGRRRGNTARLAEAFAAGAREAGHEVRTISLADKRVDGCLGCNACRYGKPCVQKDDFNSLRPDIEWADALVFASPLYFWTVSARMKAFVERFYCIAQPDPNPPKGRYEKYPEKDCALLMTSADDLFWTFSQAVAWYDFTLINYIGFRDKGKLLAAGCGGSSGPPRIQETDWLEKARAFGKVFYGEEG